MTLEKIEQLTKAYADRRQVLGDRVRQLEALLDRMKRRRVAGIRSALSEAAEAENVLRAAIADANGLFDKPRSHVFHGIKVGYHKVGGGISWSDDAAVVKLIKKHLPDQSETLIKTTETPVYAAIKSLPGATLAKIGVTLSGGSDRLVVKPVDSEIDKLVQSLLDEAVDEEGQSE